LSSKEWILANKDKQAEYKKKHYENNRQKVIDSVAERRRELRKWFDEYKSTLSCKCGENHPDCLDFHHVNPEEKDLDIAMAINRGWGREKIMREVAKCIVVCANCHRKLHSKKVSG
jgi:hypothetical protein